MKLSDEKYEEIKEEVIYLFQKYDVRCIPISGFELAVKMGITLIPYSSLAPSKLTKAYGLSFDGFYLEPGDGKEYIFYNDSQGYERTNMTILHEIGHCVLGHPDDMDSDEAEAEANFFAKYAAAPPPLVNKINPSCPEEIAEVFNISREASQYAYEYYHKWLRHYQNCGEYSFYENKLLMLFEDSIQEVFSMAQ